MKATIYFDGAAVPNPGRAAGAAIIINGSKKTIVSNFIGIATNNQAEYAGCILGLQKGLELGYTSAEVFGDSQLVIKQLCGDWQVSDPKMKYMYDQAMIVINKFQSLKFTWVRRGQNSEADQACADCLRKNQEVCL